MEAQHLPGDPGCPGKRSSRVFGGQLITDLRRMKELRGQDGFMRIFRTGKDCYYIHVNVSEDEKLMRKEARMVALSHQQAKVREENFYQECPTTVEKYRSDLLKVFDMFLGGVVVDMMIGCELHACGYDLNEIHDFEIAAGALRTILTRGVVEFDSSKELAIRDQLKMDVVRSDLALQSTLVRAKIGAIGCRNLG